KHLVRIMTLIETIVDNTAPGERRDQLLRRPIVGSAGVTSVFGKKMLPSHSRAEREEMLADFRRIVTPLWNSRIRDHAAKESQIPVDLALRGDFMRFDPFSNLFLTKNPLPLALSPDGSQFVYEPRLGAQVADPRVAPRAHLDSITKKGTLVTVRGRSASME